MDVGSRLHIYRIAVVAVLVHVLLFLFFGVRDQFVDSQRYIEMADYLIANGELEYFYQIFYAIPIGLLAMFRVLFEDGLVAFVLFQSILSTAAALALFRSAAIVFKDSSAGIFAALIYLLWFDCLQWNTAVMTESLASSLTCFVIYLLVVFHDKRKHFGLLALLLIAILMTRPTGVLVIVGVAVFLLTRYHDMLRSRPLVSAVTYSFLTIAFIVGGWAMLNEWDFTDQYVKGNIVTYMDVIEGQPLYDASLRLDTANITLPDPSKSPVEKIVFFMVDNPLHFAKAAMLKVFYVVSFYRPYFSTMHNLYTLIWLSIVYVLFYLGIRRIEDSPVKNFVIAVIIANCLLVAISAADWDNRFYMPMQPCIVLIAAGGGRRFTPWRWASARASLDGSGKSMSG